MWFVPIKTCFTYKCKWAVSIKIVALSAAFVIYQTFLKPHTKEDLKVLVPCSLNLLLTIAARAQASSFAELDCLCLGKEVGHLKGL